MLLFYKHNVKVNLKWFGSFQHVDVISAFAIFIKCDVMVYINNNNIKAI